MAEQDLRTGFSAAVPFWISLAFVPILAFAGWNGGWWIALTPVYGWYVTTLLDFFGGQNTDNPDPNDPGDLFWYRAITVLWFPIQTLLVFGSLAYVSWTDRLDTSETLFFMATVGIASGSIGIVYAHELMHQKPKWERLLGDGLMTMALYGHFRSEHLLVHHRYVGTPRDPVTARYNEGFHRFFPRVLVSSLKSSFAAEAAMLARKGVSKWHQSNPFWKYAAWQTGWLVLAFLIGGWVGVGLFCLQAFVAIWQLELVNYVEHYWIVSSKLMDKACATLCARPRW